MNTSVISKVSSVDLANYILAKQGIMSHLKLQKLIYYVEAWHLVFHDKSIIDEDFKAWVHGPVCLSVWHQNKNSSNLNGNVTLKSSDKKSAIEKVESDLSKEQLDLIKDVLEEYGDKTSYALECLTHSELPWIEARKGLSPDAPSSRNIKKSTMKTFYRSRLIS